MTDRELIGGEEDGAGLAAEYALGVLDAAGRGEAEARLKKDPAFAAEVDAWTERLGPLAEAVPSVEPPPEVWGRVAAAIDRSPRAANDDSRAVRLWKGLALGASALAAASVAAVVVFLARPEQPQTQVATHATPQGATAVVVAFDPETGALLVTPAPGLQSAGHTPHLWLVAPGGGVQLVGAIDPAKAATHHLPPDLSRRARAASGLALSLEPQGHKPIDKPGGPTVAAGNFADL